jgi:hypothetical protein
MNKGDQFTVDGVTYVVYQISEGTTYSHPNEWWFLFKQEGCRSILGFTYPRGEDWCNPPFYNVRRGGELLHPRTFEDAVRETVR